MKKKIAILGSTGSIGKSLINILKKDKKSVEVFLLTAHKNYRELYKQITIFNVKNIIITDQISYFRIKKLLKNKKINIFNNFDVIKKIFKSKKIEVISIAPMISEAMKRISNSTSVSSLFK